MRLGWLVPLSLTSTITLLGCGDDGNTDAAEDEVGDTGETADSSSTADDESGTNDSSSDDLDSSSDDLDTSSDDVDTSTDDTSTDDTSTDDTSTDDTSTDDTSTDGTDTGTDTDDATTDMESCECAANTELIYVLSDDGELWSFDPETNMFAMIAADLGCPQNQAFSMSVDRNGFAFVMFQNDDIFTVDVNNPNMCVDPNYVPGQMGFDKFGMGFVSNSIDDPCDKLYAHSWDGIGGFSEGANTGRLGVLEPDTLSLTEIDFIDYNGGELTGTGDGRLFAFAGAPAKLVEYDKATAAVLDTQQLNMPLTNAFAFAFHGGDFYMFTEGNNPSFSKVTHYDYDGNLALTTVVMQAPMRIVGAGVSTCAPVVM